MGHPGQEQEPSQLDQIKFAIVGIAPWVNFVLGGLGAAGLATYGHSLGMPWHVAAAVGFVVGFTLLHFLYDIVKLIFVAIFLWGMWYVLLRYDPQHAYALANFWYHLKASFMTP